MVHYCFCLGVTKVVGLEEAEVYVRLSFFLLFVCLHFVLLMQYV